jgi:DNA-binding response OmpR family regulator
MKILIVDDEPNIVMSLDFLLRKNGYEVFIARNGTEAMETIRREKPHIILLDVMMPDVDGYDVCRYVKSRPETSSAKVIFLSAKGRETDIQKGYDAGASLYLTKPFSTRVLLEKVKELAITSDAG